MEKNLTFIFYQKDNDFSGVLKDTAIKRRILHKIMWNNHMILKLKTVRGVDMSAYISLKYGEMLISWGDLIVDRTPKADVDYTPNIKRLLDLLG